MKRSPWCACGNLGFKVSAGEAVCPRCDEIERRLYNRSLQGVRRGLEVQRKTVRLPVEYTCHIAIP